MKYGTIEYRLRQQFDNGMSITAHTPVPPRELHDQAATRFALNDMLTEIEVVRSKTEIVGVYRRVADGSITYEAKP